MASSALIGQPTATQEDYWIAKALLQAFGMFEMDPNQGAPIPPKRPPPELYRAESRAATNITAYSISMAFMIIITMSRLCLRAFSKRMRWGLDDYLMVVAFLLALAWPTLGICNVRYGGAGRHMYDITYHQYRMFRVIGASQSAMFYAAIAFIKMSIIAFNMRLTGLTSRRWMIVHWSLFGFMIVFALLAFFLNVFMYDPVRARYDLVFAGKMDTAPKLVVNRLAVGYTLISIHIASDIILLSFFGIVLWKLQMSWAVKFRLFLIFAVGILSFASAIKWQLAQKTLAIDPLWNIHNQIGWSLVDLTAGLTVASLPVLSSIFVVAFNSIKSSLISLRSSTGDTSRNTASGSGQHVKAVTSSDKSHKLWLGKSFLKQTTWSNDSDDTIENNPSIYAATPGWEKPFGHVESNEELTTKTTARHQEEGYDNGSEFTEHHV